MIIKTDSTCPTLKSGSVKINQLYAATLIHQSIPSMIMKMLVIISSPSNLDTVISVMCKPFLGYILSFATVPTFYHTKEKPHCGGSWGGYGLLA